MAEKQSPFGVSDLLAAPVRVKKSLRDCQCRARSHACPGPPGPSFYVCLLWTRQIFTSRDSLI
jgi:hypothetical protein